MSAVIEVQHLHKSYRDTVLPAIEAGATGYLLKDAPRADLLRAVQAAARGEAVLSPSVAARLMSRVRAPRRRPAQPART
jgi:DNA-binding NarL/FixJ family response regulator